MSSARPRRTAARRSVAAGAAAALALGGAAGLLAPTASTASSHREAPLVISDPQIDNTDTYAFVSPDKPDTVTLVGNWLPFEEPAGGPNFYPFATAAQYDFKIDNNGDAKPDITYRWTFTDVDRRATVQYPPADKQNDGTFLYNNGPVTSFDDPDLLFKQTYTLTRITPAGSTVVTTNAPVAPSRVGGASFPDYGVLRDQAVTSLPGGGKSFAGQAEDSFFLDLRVFDLLYGANLTEVGDDTVDGFNVNTIALQVPKSELVSGSGDPVIGVWSTTQRPALKTTNTDGSQTYSGDWVQVSRLGAPLVNEVVIPSHLKDAFNALAPENDATVQPAVDRVLYPELPKLLTAIYGVPTPAEPRNDLFSVFLTGVEGLNRPQGTVRPAEMLRLNTAIAPAKKPDRLGVIAGDNAGFPNGRRLADDVVDIALQVVAGELVGNPNDLGDSVDKNDVAFGTTFPYVALPFSGSDANPHSPSNAANAKGAQGAKTDNGKSSGGSGNQAVGFSEEAPALPVLPSMLALAGLALAAVGGVSLRRSRALVRGTDS